MDRTHLSDLFKFVHGFGQKGHQIGRKIGDALELVVLGAINRCPELAKHLVIEPGVEGATTAEHKVEFAFYQLDKLGSPTKRITDLFGIVECKKVGVEMTIKGSFKAWQAANKAKTFSETGGYTFTQNVSAGDKRTIRIAPVFSGGNLRISVSYRNSSAADANQTFKAKAGDKFLITITADGGFRLLSNLESLVDVEAPIQSCIIVTIKEVYSEGLLIKSILVEDCLAGPQTPEKAKQASFVSLDVRKKLLGRFDKDASDSRFTSVLVIGEASHWEKKSRAMVRLCNDWNLIVPDAVIEEFFKRMKMEFGEAYQERISKSFYGSDKIIREMTDAVIEKFGGRVMCDMDTSVYKAFNLAVHDGVPCLRVVNL
jgi:hypothetical protein